MLYLPAPLVSLRKLFVRILPRVLAWYLIFGALIFTLQREFIYHPDALSEHEFTLTAQSFSGFSEIIEPYSAVVLEPKNKAFGTVVLFHGNAGTALDRELYAQDILARGFRCVLAEFPGYGTRDGEISEDAWVADAKNLISELRARYPNEELVVMGESIGTGVAVRVAAESPQPPERLVLLTPFSSLQEVAGRKLPMYPISLLLKDPFKSNEHIRRYAGPVSLLIAENDEVVGAASGRALLKAAQDRGPTQAVSVPNAGHNTWYQKTREAEWDTLLGRGLRRSDTAGK